MKNLFLLAASFFIATTLHAKEIKGINFSDEVKIEKTTLKLNGLGLRKAYGIVNVYAAGLYLSEPSHDVDTILKLTTPKQIKMHFMRYVQKGQLQDAFKEGFQKNRDEDYKYTSDLNKLNDSLKHMKENDEMTLTFYPDQASVQIRDEAPIVISGAEFSKTLLKVFINRAPDEGLKKGLLGL